MTANDFSRFKEVFAQAQHSVAAHKKLENELKTLYDKLPYKVFFETFTQCLRVPLMCGEKAAPVERTLDFAVNFVTSFMKKKAVPESEGINDEGGSDEDDETPKFVTDIFKFMCENAGALNQTVRFRICQFINKLLNGLGNEACMDDDLCDVLCDRMLERLKDKSPLVRSQAVRALYRLQDPNDADCRVTSAYIFHFSSDPSPDVRATALTNIAISSHSVRAILERSQDTSETVRKIAFTRLAEMNIQRFSIEMRVRLLERGLKDSSDKVRKTATNELLRSWFDFHKGSFVPFLHALDPEHSTETSTLALETMFQSFKIGLTSAIEQIRKLQGSDKLIPVEELAAENVLLWKVLIVYLEKHPEIAEERPVDEPLEDVVPELSTFCTYILKYFSQPVPDDDPYVFVQREYVLRQLVEMCDTFDFSDEMGRSNLRSTCQTLLLNNRVSDRVVPTLVKIIVKVVPDVDDRLQCLAEVISELHDPTADLEEVPQPPVQMTVVLTAEEKRQLDIKEAKIKMKLNEMSEDQDEAVKAKDFIRAQQLQEECQKLRDELKSLTSPPPPPPVEKPATQEARPEELIIKDRSKLRKCLCIVKEMMQHPSVLSLTPTLRSLMHNFVMPCLQQQADDPVIKNMALEAMGLFCLFDSDLAKEHFVYMFCFQIANDEVCETALKLTFDLLYLYGLEMFEVEESKTDDPSKKRPKKKKNLFVTDATEDEFEEDEDDTQSQTINSTNANTANLIGMLTSLLNSASTTMRNLAMKGLCKLLLACRMTSPALLSRLIVMWYSPVTDGDEDFRQPLATFLGALSTICPRGQEMLEQAFLPTLRTIRDAPTDSPLSEVDLESVIKLFISLTRPGKSKFHKKQTTHVHNAFAVSLCNEILNQDDHYSDDGIFLRSLVQLELCLDDPVYRQDLRNFIALMKEAYTSRKEKLMLRYVEKFENMVENSVPEAQAACAEVDNTAQTEQLSNVDNTVRTSVANSADNTAQSSQLNGPSVVKKSRKNARILRKVEETVDDMDDDNASVDSIEFTISGQHEGTVIPESPPTYEVSSGEAEFDSQADAKEAGLQHSKRRRISEDKTTTAVSSPKKAVSSPTSKSQGATSKAGRRMQNKEVSPPRTPKKTAESTEDARNRKGATLAAQVVEATKPTATRRGAGTSKESTVSSRRNRDSSQEGETSSGETQQRESRRRTRTVEVVAERVEQKAAPSKRRDVDKRVNLGKQSSEKSMDSQDSSEDDAEPTKKKAEPTKRRVVNKRVNQEKESPEKSTDSQDSSEDDAEPTKKRAVEKRANQRRGSPVKPRDKDSAEDDAEPTKKRAVEKRSSVRKESPVKSKDREDSVNSAGKGLRVLVVDLSAVRPRREVKLTPRALAYKKNLSKRTSSEGKSGTSPTRTPPTQKGSARAQTPKSPVEEEEFESAPEASASPTPAKKTRSTRFSGLDSPAKDKASQRKAPAKNQKPFNKAKEASLQSLSSAKQKAAPAKKQESSGKAKGATSSDEDSSPSRSTRSLRKVPVAGTTSSPVTQRPNIRKAPKRAAQKMVSESSGETSSPGRRPPRIKAPTQQNASSDSPMPTSSSSGTTSKSIAKVTFTKTVIPTSSSEDSSEHEKAVRSANRAKPEKATNSPKKTTWHLPTQSEILQRAVERARSGVLSQESSPSRTSAASSSHSPGQDSIIQLAVDRLRKSVVFSQESSSASSSPVYRILPTSNSSSSASPARSRTSESSQEITGKRTSTRATSKVSPAQSSDKAASKKTREPSDKKTPVKQAKSSSGSSSPSGKGSATKSSDKSKPKTSLGRLSSSSTSSSPMSTRSQDLPNKLRARKRI